MREYGLASDRSIASATSTRDSAGAKDRSGAGHDGLAHRLGADRRLLRRLPRRFRAASRCSRTLARAPTDRHAPSAGGRVFHRRGRGALLHRHVGLCGAPTAASRWSRRMRCQIAPASACATRSTPSALTGVADGEQPATAARPPRVPHRAGADFAPARHRDWRCAGRAGHLVARARDRRKVGARRHDADGAQGRRRSGGGAHQLEAARDDHVVGKLRPQHGHHWLAPSRRTPASSTSSPAAWSRTCPSTCAIPTTANVRAAERDPYRLLRTPSRAKSTSRFRGASTLRAPSSCRSRRWCRSG